MFFRPSPTAHAASSRGHPFAFLCLQPLFRASQPSCCKILKYSASTASFVGGRAKLRDGVTGPPTGLSASLDARRRPIAIYHPQSYLVRGPKRVVLIELVRTVRPECKQSDFFERHCEGQQQGPHCYLSTRSHRAAAAWHFLCSCCFDVEAKVFMCIASAEDKAYAQRPHQSFAALSAYQWRSARPLSPRSIELDCKARDVVAKTHHA